MKKIVFKIIFIGLFVVSFANAEDAKVPCRNKDGSLGLNSLSSFDCQLASNISSDPSIQDEFKDFIDKKLALSLSQKASELVEDLALLDSYFDQAGIDLGKNENVRNSCQLEKIAQPNCGSGVKKELIQKKMSFILGTDKFLPKGEKNSSLYKRLLLKANQVRSGTTLKEVNKCPVEGNSGMFTILSQFTSSDARMLIDLVKKGDMENETLSEMFSKYPQLKMLVNGKDESLKRKFEAAMSKFSAGDEKKFVDDFFKEKTSQESMAISVSNKCKELQISIQKYTCSDNYPHLAMNEDDRDFLFEKTKDDKIFKEVARGLSCEMEAKAKASDSGEDPLKAANTIHDKMELFQKDLRIQETSNVINEKIGPFCDLYLCKSTLIKPEMISCKNGGPISSKDIIEGICENNVSKCEDKYQKYISYLISLERDAINTGVATNSSGNSNLPNQSSLPGDKPRGFTSFYQNLLGVEGTIAAEGKKVTPITVAEKKAEFAEKKLDTTPINIASLSQNKESVKVESRQEPITPQLEDSSGVDAHTAALRDADQFRRSFQAQQFSKANYDITKDASGKSKKVKFTDTESSTLDEMKKLRGELADALGKVKGSEEEQLAAVADNNAVAITPKGSKKDPVRNLNQGEKERLDAYRDSLNNWEGRLRTWQGNLSDRDVRINSGSGSSGDNKVDAPVANSDQYNIANNNGSGAKLSKTSAGGSVAAGKGEAGVDRAPGSEKVEGELGVVNSENLATLEKDSLKKLGIVATDSFIIKVRHKEKIYSVPVKTFNHGGKSMYVPLLNEKDRELSKIVYESPLFKDYRAYQIKRQYQLDQI